MTIMITIICSRQQYLSQYQQHWLRITSRLWLILNSQIWRPPVSECTSLDANWWAGQRIVVIWEEMGGWGMASAGSNRGSTLREQDLEHGCLDHLLDIAGVAVPQLRLQLLSGERNDMLCPSRMLMNLENLLFPNFVVLHNVGPYGWGGVRACLTIRTLLYSLSHAACVRVWSMNFLMAWSWRF